MRSFTCGTETAEFLILRLPPQDHPLPQDFGERTSVWPVSCSFGWQYIYRGTINTESPIISGKMKLHLIFALILSYTLIHHTNDIEMRYR